MFRMLTIFDEFTGECLAIRVDRHLHSLAVLAVLSDLTVARGVPDHIKSDLLIQGAIGFSPMGDGPEFAAHASRERIEKVGTKTLFIEPGSP